MENTLLNEEMVVNTAEEIAKVGLNKGVKVAIGVGVTALVGGVAYKKLVKPLVAKHKAKNDQSKDVADNDHDIYDDEPKDELK